MTDRIKAILESRSQSWGPEYDEQEPLEDIGQIFRNCIVTDTIQAGSVLPENVANFSELLATYSTYVNEMIERRWHMTLTDRVLSELRSRVQSLENHQTLVVP